MNEVDDIRSKFEAEFQDGEVLERQGLGYKQDNVNCMWLGYLAAFNRQQMPLVCRQLSTIW